MNTGSGWVRAGSPPQSFHASDHVTSYRHPLPAGTTQVQYRFQSDGFWELGLGCLMENPVVVHRTG